MNEDIDCGKILKVKYFILNDNDDIFTIHFKANDLFSSMIIKLLPLIFKKKVKEKKQNENLAQYWHQRSDQDGKIDWTNMSAKRVHNLIRALTKPYKGAYTYYNDQRLRIYKSTISIKKFYGSPGRIVKIKNNNLLVICADFGLIIDDYKFENSNRQLKNGMFLK